MSRIGTVADFHALVQQTPLVVVTSYRGKWCPFCLQYLRALNNAYQNLPDNCLIIGVSVDPSNECAKLQKKLRLGFDLLSDENLVMGTLFNIPLGKGHGKEAYLQPSVFIFKAGEKVFEWVQKPRMLNFGGAINRLPVSEVVREIAKLS